MTPQSHRLRVVLASRITPTKAAPVIHEIPPMLVKKRLLSRSLKGSQKKSL